MKTKMKHYLFGLTIYFCHFTLSAQNKNIDSLLTLFKKDKPDTNKIIHSIKLCAEYQDIGLNDTALYYCKSALQLANQLNFKNGIANSCGNIGNIYWTQGNYSIALEYYFKALKSFEE